MEALRTLVVLHQQQSGSEIAFKAFGRSEMGIVEVPVESLLASAMWLRSDEALRFDWVEMLTAYERKGRLHLSYFLRSQARSESCVLRTGVELPGAREWVKVSSLVGLWPMLRPYEEEISALHGVHFTKGTVDTATPTASDFPMRKGFMPGPGRNSK